MEKKLHHLPDGDEDAGAGESAAFPTFPLPGPCCGGNAGGDVHPRSGCPPGKGATLGGGSDGSGGAAAVARGGGGAERVTGEGSGEISGESQGLRAVLGPLAGGVMDDDEGPAPEGRGGGAALLGLPPGAADGDPNGDEALERVEGEGAEPVDGGGALQGEIAGPENGYSKDSDGEGLGPSRDVIESFRYEDSRTSFTLPKTEWSSPRFSGGPVIVCASCFNLGGRRLRLPTSDRTEASTITGGEAEEPFRFVICTYTFCRTPEK